MSAAATETTAGSIGRNTGAEVVAFPTSRTKTAESRLRPACEFVHEFVPLTYVVEPIVRTNSMYTLTAKTGSGKTGLAVIVALAVAAGRNDILKLDVERGRVVYCAFENPDDVRMRLMAAAWLLEVDLADLGNKLLVLDARTKPEGLIETLRKASSAGPLALVVVDTFAAAFDGENVNDNVQSGQFVRRLRPITQLDGAPALLIAAHPIKNASDDQLVPYGAGAILNEVDGNLTLSKRTTGVTLLHHQGKFRGLEFPPIAFQFELVSPPDVHDNKGRPVSLPVLRPCKVQDEERNRREDVDRKIKILRAMQDNPKATGRSLEASLKISRTTISRIQGALKQARLIERHPVSGELRLTAKGVNEAAKLETSDV